MKSNPLNMSELDWNSSITKLYPTKIPKSVEKLIASGINRLEDLLWIFPLKIQLIPKLAPISNAKIGYLFKGAANNLIYRPNMGRLEKTYRWTKV